MQMQMQTLDNIENGIERQPLAFQSNYVVYLYVSKRIGLAYIYANTPTTC